MLVAEVASVSGEFGIFAHRPIQAAVLRTVEIVYKILAPVEQRFLQFPGNKSSYIDLDIKLYVPGKLVSRSGKYVDLTDTTRVTNNLLHSLFMQCTVTFNGVPVTQSNEHYYRAWLETLQTYCSDPATSHLTNTYWYLDTDA